MLLRIFRAAALAGALIAAPLAAPAGPITGYPAASTPLAGTETVIGNQSPTGTVQITTASIAAINYSVAGTWTQPQTFPAPGAGVGSIVLTPGSSPTSPPNGSLWITSAGLFYEVGSATQQAVGNGANSWSGLQTFEAPGSGHGSVVLTPGSVSGTPADGSLWTTSSGLFAQISGASLEFATTGANTWTGEQRFAASTTANAGVNLGQGSGPTSPANGDLWVTSSGVFARVNGSTAALGVTVPTAAAGGSSGQVQYNCSSVLCGMTGYSYSTTNDALTLPGGGVINTNGIQIGSSSTLDINGTVLVSNSTPLIFVPGCGGGASWMIGPDGGYCSHALAGSSDNIGIGTIVFGNVTSGCCDTTAGSENMKNLTTGSYNSSFGFESLHIITTGARNSALGASALNNLTTGNFNIGIGAGAGAGVTTGSDNVCVFSACGATGTLTGSNNVVVGGGGATLTSGNRNVFIGDTNDNTGYGIVTGNGNVSIGSQFTTLADQSDSVTIGDGDTHILMQYLPANGYLNVTKQIDVNGVPVGHPVWLQGTSTALAGAHEVMGTSTLSGGTASVTFSALGMDFTSSASYVCTATDQTAAAAVKIANSSATTFIITGTSTDVIGWRCTGN